MNRYRVFISYSHEDRGLAERIACVLREMNLEPIWDKHIRPGSAFTEAIKGLIAHAHIFMPLITDNSRERPWVHQETGYAMALNIPVLPLAVLSEPGEMISQLQAIKVLPDASDLVDRLKEVNLDHVVMPPPRWPISLTEIADWPEKRAELLAQFADRVVELGYHGRLRHRGALSSFSIPDADVEDAIWAVRSGANPRSDYYYHCIRQERVALEKHARSAGCDLLLDPTVLTSGAVPQASIVRLNTLLEFIESMPQDKLRIVCSERARDANITMVGDWFIAESRLRHPKEGWRQTFFSWHGPTVLRAVQAFDQTFESLFATFSKDTDDPRAKAVSQIQGIISELQRPE